MTFYPTVDILHKPSDYYRSLIICPEHLPFIVSFPFLQGAPPPPPPHPIPLSSAHTHTHTHTVLFLLSRSFVWCKSASECRQLLGYWNCHLDPWPLISNATMLDPIGIWLSSVCTSVAVPLSGWVDEIKCCSFHYSCKKKTRNTGNTSIYSDWSPEVVKHEEAQT